MLSKHSVESAIVDVGSKLVSTFNLLVFKKFAHILVLSFVDALYQFLLDCQWILLDSGGKRNWNFAGATQWCLREISGLQ